jgi:hypothetical protein
MIGTYQTLCYLCRTFVGSRFCVTYRTIQLHTHLSNIFLIRLTPCADKVIGVGRAMAQAVSRRPLTAEARVRSLVGPCVICGGQSGTGTGFSPITSVFLCQFHSTGGPLLGKNGKTNHLHRRLSQCRTISLKAAVRS